MSDNQIMTVNITILSSLARRVFPDDSLTGSSVNSEGVSSELDFAVAVTLRSAPELLIGVFECMSYAPVTRLS